MLPGKNLKDIEFSRIDGLHCLLLAVIIVLVVVAFAGWTDTWFADQVALELALHCGGTK